MTGLDVINRLNDDLIDQIVEGTLTPAQLRGAIDRLDRQPNGWKRCALAFIEAQCWRESFRLVGASKATSRDVDSTSLKLNSFRANRSSRRWPSRALAASVLVASFALGWLGNGVRFELLPDKTVAHRSEEPGNEPLTKSELEGPTTIVGEAPRSIGRATANPIDEVTTVARLSVGSADAKDSVPILAGPGINTEWLKRQPPPVSEHGLAMLKKHGYQVDQRRRLISGVLADGRRVTVPIDQVQIRYRGNDPL